MKNDFGFYSHKDIGDRQCFAGADGLELKQYPRVGYLRSINYDTKATPPALSTRNLKALQHHSINHQPS